MLFIYSRRWELVRWTSQFWICKVLDIHICITRNQATLSWLLSASNNKMTERISHIYKLDVILLVGYTTSFHIIKEKQTLKFLKIFQDSWAEEYGTKKEEYFLGLTISEILEEQLKLFWEKQNVGMLGQEGVGYW